MAKQVENLSLNMIGLMAPPPLSEGDGERPFYIDEHLFMVMHLIDSGPMNLVADQPYRVDEGRVLMVTRDHHPSADGLAVGTETHCRP